MQQRKVVTPLRSAAGSRSTTIPTLIPTPIPTQTPTPAPAPKARRLDVGDIIRCARFAYGLRIGNRLEVGGGTCVSGSDRSRADAWFRVREATEVSRFPQLSGSMARKGYRLQAVRLDQKFAELDEVITFFTTGEFDDRIDQGEIEVLEQALEMVEEPAKRRGGAAK